MAPQLTFALVLAVLHTTSLLGATAIYTRLLARGALAKQRVAEGAAPDAGLLKQATREVLLGQPIFGVLCYFAVYPLWVRAGGEMTASFASVWEALLTFVWHFAVFVFLNDTIFYFSHRLLHTRWLFKHVHVRHHRFRFVRGLVAEYAHPVEDAANFIAFFAGPVLLGSPFPIVATWVFLRMLETVDAHSGYALTPAASRHAFHHMYAARGCYGSFAGLWDRVLGTEREWRKWRDEGSPTPRSVS
jgi:sterol desaturase/sphingolipid hydroxylase (fatty acid hydroxylase superfamily)